MLSAACTDQKWTDCFSTLSSAVCVESHLPHVLRGTSHDRTKSHAVAVDKAMWSVFGRYIDFEDEFDCRKMLQD